jgi:hypothetical protein
MHCKQDGDFKSRSQYKDAEWPGAMDVPLTGIFRRPQFSFVAELMQLSLAPLATSFYFSRSSHV